MEDMEAGWNAVWSVSFAIFWVEVWTAIRITINHWLSLIRMRQNETNMFLRLYQKETCFPDTCWNSQAETFLPQAGFKTRRACCTCAGIHTHPCNMCLHDAFWQQGQKVWAVAHLEYLRIYGRYMIKPSFLHILILTHCAGSVGLQQQSPPLVAHWNWAAFEWHQQPLSFDPSMIHPFFIHLLVIWTFQQCPK